MAAAVEVGAAEAAAAAALSSDNGTLVGKQQAGAVPERGLAVTGTGQRLSACAVPGVNHGSSHPCRCTLALSIV